VNVLLGVAYRGLQDYDNAEKYYNAAIKLDPKNPSAYFNMGNLYQDYAITKPDLTPIKKVETAIDYYNKFKEKAGKDKEWESYIKQADVRLGQCKQLRDVLLKTAAASGSGSTN
jgi:tetratricopeptide (TPR) repeat protein